MTTDRLRRIQQIFDDTLAVAADERAAFIAQACGDDAELRAEVELMLARAEEVSPNFMQPPKLAPGTKPNASASPARLVGQTIGRFRIKAVIASGGMGTVYEAVQDQPHRAVALKVMGRNVASRSALHRFQFEWEVLGRLRHPNIAQVYDAGIHGTGADAVPYFAMEYIPDARSVVQHATERELSTRERLRVFARVCDAVQHGHQKGIIHRDLKPSNILVDPSGEPKIIDFGVARATDADLAITTVKTDIGELIGTLQYMSPEQCDADPHEIDTRSDVYSLGVILYELLCDRLPYNVRRTGIIEAARVIHEEQPPRPSTIDRKLRGDVETIALKALDKDRDKRYQSAADLAQDIRRYLNREPIEAKPPSWATRAARVVARHPVPFAAVSSIVVGTLLAASAILADRRVRLERHSLRIDSDGRVLQIIGRGGQVLDGWSSEQRTAFRFADIVDRSVWQGGKLMIVGLANAPDVKHSGSLCAFRASDQFGPPIWTRGVNTDEIPPGIRDEHSLVGEDFSIDSGGLSDVFPTDEYPGTEIIATYTHARWGVALARIYDLTGNILYEVWHKGTLPYHYWMQEAGLLLFLGLDNSREWKSFGFSDVHNQYPVVVFAVRPKPEAHVLHFIGELPPRREGDHPVWWHLLVPPSARDWADPIKLVPPIKRFEPGRHAEIVVQTRDSPAGSVSWVIDGNGKMVPGSRVVSDDFLRGEGRPDPESLKLVSASQLEEDEGNGQR